MIWHGPQTGPVTGGPVRVTVTYPALLPMDSDWLRYLHPARLCQ
jgi:hypothetical protein